MVLRYPPLTFRLSAFYGISQFISNPAAAIIGIYNMPGIGFFCLDGGGIDSCQAVRATGGA